MIVPDFDPLHLTRAICALAVLIQTVELLALRTHYNDSGTWRWSIIKQEIEKLPKPISALLSVVLPYRCFTVLLAIRIPAACAALVLNNFWILAFLLITNLLISIRWRGAFNGGSDYMTTLILLSLSLAALFPQSPTIYLACVYYIAFQTCCSYFLAGVAKLRSPNWRSGAALHAFLLSGVFNVSDAILKPLRNRGLALLASWSIIIFECAFPLALLDQNLCLLILCAGVFFHLMNAWVLGLNRFLLIWMAAYPVILWCSG